MFIGRTNGSIGRTAQKALLKLVVDERKVLQTQVKRIVDFRLSAQQPDGNESATKTAFGLFEKLAKAIPTGAMKTPPAEALQKLWECRDK